MERDDRNDRKEGDVGATLTMPAGTGDTAAAGTDETFQAAAGSAGAPVVVRAGAQGDLAELPSIDPRHYAVGAELARGGMGRILSARDRRLGRAVAIKELLRGGADARVRFEREARITARLQHPAIVSLYEAGRWPGGEPFYVMKLVEGEPLDRKIQDRSFEERLGLVSHVIAVVDALAYAHGKGVIHRDLKPSNVLIGDHGETVVIDWGLAKELADTDPEAAAPATAGADETVAGAVMGTPAYMPPEQARGAAVGPAADVYALGAILYHVLTGEPLYRGASSDEVLAQVQAAPPRPIAEVEPRVPPDLVTIVDKATARDPDARYPSALELADDLKRFQTGQLVGAHRYTLDQLVRRWLGRHRVAVTVAGVLLALLAATLVVSVRRVLSERDEANRQRSLARANQAESEDLLGFMLGDLRDRLKPLGRLDLLDAAATKAVTYYDRRSDGGSDVQRAQRAAALDNLSQVLHFQGRTAEAIAKQRAALAIRADLVARQPGSSDRQHALAISHQRVGELVEAQGDPDGALAEYRILQRQSDAQVAAAPEDERWQVTRSLAHRMVGGALEARGDVAAALVEYRKALEIALEHGTNGTNEHWPKSIATAHTNIADALATLGDQAGALAEHRAALAATEKWVALDTANADALRDLASDRESVARALEAVGDRAAALSEFRASQAILERLASVDGADVRVQSALARRHSQIGNVMAQQSDSAGALAEHQKALAIRERLAALNPTNAETQRDVSVTRERLGNLFKNMGKPDDAIASYQAGLAIMERLVAGGRGKVEWQLDVATLHKRVADILEQKGDLDGALAEQRVAKERHEELVRRDPNNATWAFAHYASRFNISLLMKKKGDVAGALAELRSALPAIERLVARDPKNASNLRALAVGRKYLGGWLEETGNHADALEQLGKALAGTEALLKIDPANATWQQDAQLIHAEIGEVHWNAKDYAPSLVEYRAALAIAEKLATADPADLGVQQALAVACNDVADVLAAQGDVAGARAGYRRALAIAEPLLAADPTSAMNQAIVKQVRGSLRTCCGGR